jgi:divalent metal cation (Fe/Co/Zn/Cd) transporter
MVAPMAIAAEPIRHAEMRLNAAIISLVVGLVLLAAKYVAYRLTGSTAILSDALESIVNVIAALFAIGGLLFAGRPADRNHPYGHGKIEFFSAAFEGGLISFAALLIVYEAVRVLLAGAVVQALDKGVLITVAAGLVNAGLGVYLIRTGRRTQSLTLVADGLVTGRAWFDPLIAALVGAQLGWTGFRLVRHAAGGLLDEEDTELLQRLVAALNENLAPGIIRVHYLRAIRSGRFTHVDAHLVVPEFWTVERAHELADGFEARVIAALPFDGEIAFHTDPCRRAYCARCDIADCPIRQAPFTGRSPMTVDEVVQDDVALFEQADAAPSST